MQAKRGRTLVLLALTLGVLALATTSQASSMTPYQNGITWIADICADDPAGRTPIECIRAKCAALYGVGTGAYNDCVAGAVTGVLTSPPTPSGPSTPGTPGSSAP